MFLKTGELKKLMKSSLKRQQLSIGLIETEEESYYLVGSDFWGLRVDGDAATNKFKAAIMELVGEIPERGRCYAYELNPDIGLTSSVKWDYPDPYQEWLRAKDSAKESPILLSLWPYEYRIYQKESTREYLAVNRAWTDSLFSPNELIDGETMPKKPSLYSTGEDTGILYFKNETTIYWIRSISPGEKSREVLFPALRNVDFWEDDWIWKRQKDDKGEEEALPY